MTRTHYTEEQSIFRRSFRGWLQKNVVPHQEDWRKAGLVPREVWRAAGAQGFLSPMVAEDYGGAGCDDFRYDQILGEELSYIGETGLMIPLHSCICTPYLVAFGTLEQKQRWLPGVVTGEVVLAVAMTEPGAGSDLAGMRTNAVDKGDHWLLNGSKTFISNGLNSELVIVAARTHPEQSHGISLFLVEKSRAGFTVGRKLEKLGLHSQDTCELFFSDLKLPKENLLGDLHGGFKHLMQMLAPERLSCAIGAVAAARAALDVTVAYTKERTAFGKPLAAMPTTRHRLAEMKTEVEIGEAYVDRLVLAQNAGDLTVVDAAQGKLWTSEMLGRVVDAGVQLHGGYGFMMEYPITRMYADARIMRIYAGTSEIMKEIISRGMGLEA